MVARGMGTPDLSITRQAIIHRAPAEHKTEPGPIGVPSKSGGCVFRAWTPACAGATAPSGSLVILTKAGTHFHLESLRLTLTGPCRSHGCDAPARHGTNAPKHKNSAERLNAVLRCTMLFSVIAVGVLPVTGMLWGSYATSGAAAARCAAWPYRPGSRGHPPTCR
jgi:hypothetical protein